MFSVVNSWPLRLFTTFLGLFCFKSLELPLEKSLGTLQEYIFRAYLGVCSS